MKQSFKKVFHLEKAGACKGWGKDTPLPEAISDSLYFLNFWDHYAYAFEE